MDRDDRKALTLAVGLVLAVLLALAARAHAQAPGDGPVPQAGPSGAPGLWFPLEDAREAVACLGDRVALGERLRLTTESLTLADAQVAVLRARTLELATLLSAESDARAAAEAEVRAAGEWYRSPWVWGVVGLVVGVGAAVVLAVAL